MSSNILWKAIVNFLYIQRNIKTTTILFQYITVFHKTRISRDDILVNEGLNNFLNILLTKSVLATVFLKSTAGINQENTFSRFCIFLVNNDNTSWNTGTIEKVLWQTYDALNVSFLQNLDTDSFLSITSKQNAVRHNNTSLSVTIQRFQNVQKPSIVAVLFGRNTIPIKSFILIFARFNPIRP